MDRQEDQTGKDVHQLRGMKDREGNVLIYKERVLRRWEVLLGADE